MKNKLFYLTAGIFTVNVIFSFIIGETQTAIQLGFATIVLWMWAYLLESNKLYQVKEEK